MRKRFLLVILLMIISIITIGCDDDKKNSVIDDDEVTESANDKDISISDDDETVDITVDEDILISDDNETVDEDILISDDDEVADIDIDEEISITDKPEIRGLYNNNWGSFVNVDLSSWHNRTDTTYAYTNVDNATNTIIAQNGSSNTYNPNKFSRFDWTLDNGKLYFCQTVYDAENATDALATPAADDTDISAGCSGFSWSEMRQLELIGDYSDEWETSHTVSTDKWLMGNSLFNIEYFINENNMMIAQNDAGNEYYAGLWSRFDWVQHEDSLYFCQTAYDAATFEDALNSDRGDDTNPADSGCGGYSWTKISFANKAEEAGSTAVAKDSSYISSWADAVEKYTVGEDVDNTWTDSSKALGAAEGTSGDIVSLGRGGSIVLSFHPAITNGNGADFAVFENSFSDTFLELAWVEVSSNGVDWVRFPAISLTADTVSSMGNINAKDIDGFAGKYRQGFGTPFDLEKLILFPAITMGIVDLNNIGYVRIVDVVGDGSELDTMGNPVYDPYKTMGSSGFDLDAIAVINSL